MRIRSSASLSALQLDSLRAAIDDLSPAATPERDLLLSALLLAATVCSTGPHFAQLQES